jgi:hypothetical protein
MPSGRCRAYLARARRRSGGGAEIDEQDLIGIGKIEKA